MTIDNNKTIWLGPQVGQRVRAEYMATNSTASLLTWRNWTSTDATATTIWSNWMQDYRSGVTGPSNVFNVATASSAPTKQILTPEQIRQAEEAQRVREEQYRVQVRLGNEAEDRARLLMQKCLSPAEWESYQEKGYIDITCPSGMVYRIEKGSHGNIKEMVKGADGKLRAVARLCAQPDGIPLADVNLSQYLHLLHDEEGFRRVANRTLWR